jgi:hypothetical protein
VRFMLSHAIRCCAMLPGLLPIRHHERVGRERLVPRPCLGLYPRGRTLPEDSDG